LIYGDHDWSRPEEREAEQGDVPRAELRTIRGAGHFLALDAPDELIHHVTEFESTTGGQPGREISPLASRS
jgi:pimeloyl-ACP methyl ester carboxylesterase